MAVSPADPDPLGASLVADLLSRSAFPPGTGPLDCGVSGGPDSLALLVLAAAAGHPVTAWYVDHGLRPGASAEAQVVADAASRFGAEFQAVPAPVEHGPNLEARARRARYAALPSGVLVGHTMDDQAETMLLNLLRGAGPAGMAGIRSDGRRPLLGLRRAETRALCAELGLEPVDDPSNRDRRFRRNRVRHELLGILSDIAERDIVPVLARQAGLFAAEDDLLTDLAAGLDPTDARAVAAAAEPLARRALRRWITADTGCDHPPDAATVDRALAVARGEHRATDVGRGWRLARTAGRLRLEPG